MHLNACSATGQDRENRLRPAGRVLRAVTLACGLLLGGAEAGWAKDRPQQPVAPSSLIKQGKLVYAQNCQGCHGPTLSGGFAPPVRGAAFRAKWVSQAGAALTDYLARTMPPANPGGLPPDSYRSLAAFLRATNKLSPADPGATAALAQDSASKPSATSEAGGMGSVIENRDDVYQAAMARHAALLAGMSDVGDDMLRHPKQGDWLNWRRTDDGAGYSPLAQISKSTVKSLGLAWSLALPVGTNELTPLVHDGVMFLNSNGTVLAIDADSGDVLWRFVRPATASPIGPPVSQPHSMAIYENRLFVPTLDNHMIALDLQSGKIVWDHAIVASFKTYRLIAGPLIVHGKIIQGVSGCAGTGEPGGCFIVALDAKNGDELWRVRTLQQPGGAEPDSWNQIPAAERYGGSVWAGGTYDEDLNLVYFGTGQTYHITPLMAHGSLASAANSALYTDSTLAIDPDSGKLVWFYQHMARDVWDLDWAFERMIVTIDDHGQKRRVVATMGKLGILDVLDARDGHYIFSVDLGLQNLVTSIDPVTGWKSTDPALEPDPNQPKFICPFPTGVRNWPSTAYDPERHLIIVPASKSCMEYLWKKGDAFDITYSPRAPKDGDSNIGGLFAINLDSRKVEWASRYRAVTASSALTTAGGLIFTGNRDRRFQATDDASGQVLWQARLDTVPSASPISYEANGTQYIAVTTGGGGPHDASQQSLTPEVDPTIHATTLWVFKLAGDAR